MKTAIFLLLIIAVFSLVIEALLDRKTHDNIALHFLQEFFKICSTVALAVFALMATVIIGRGMGYVMFDAGTPEGLLAVLITLILSGAIGYFLHKILLSVINKRLHMLVKFMKATKNIDRSKWSLLQRKVVKFAYSFMML